MEQHMRRIATAAVILLVSASTAVACGRERWPVKVGTDRDAAKVSLSPIPAAIALLGAIRPPAHPDRRRASRFAPTEFRVFQVSGTLAVIKRERDEDYHLVVENPDDPSATMIAEAPDPGCARGSVFYGDIAHVRAVLDGKFGDFRRLRPDLPVTVSGVGFFDVIHGQEGVAPNGIELHPILDIHFGAAAGG